MIEGYSQSTQFISIENTSPEISTDFKRQMIKSSLLCRVEDQVKHIIRSARKEKKLISSLGRIWGENSRQNKLLKGVLQRPPREVSPKLALDPVMERMKKEADMVIDLVAHGFRQLGRRVPKKIQREIAELNMSFHKIKYI